MKLVNYITLKQIPRDSYVIRVKDTNKYIHLLNGRMELLPQMTGCYVVRKATAERLVEMFDEKYGKQPFEIISFFISYEEHGVIEKKMKYN